jgi:adenine-specific DNA-methyltransferase
VSRLTELIAQVAKADPALADDLRREVEVLSSRRPYGLNFERHVPESVQLPRRKIRRGDKVVFRDAGRSDRQPWVVVSFEGNGAKRKVQLIRRAPSEEQERTSAALSDLVVIAEFRDSIYPGLRSTGVVEQGGDKPYHAVINGESYHVLQALSFVCRGRVDCIYIDPPYNTRDKDWKYNNDYVDADDGYKHSKWLAMMERRLVLSKELLNPEDSALIVTIDEKEYLRLGLLLEQLFPDASIQMVTSVISAKGAVRRGRFSRVEEHIFYVLLGRARIHPWVRNMLTADDAVDADEEPSKRSEGEDGTVATEVGDETEPEDSPKPESPQPVEWLGLRRREPSALRGSRKNQFFAIFVDRDTGVIHSIGDAIEDTAVDRRTVKAPRGTVALWPLKPDGTERIWGLTPDAVRKNLSSGYVRVNTWNPDKLTGTVQYLPGGTIAKISKGDAVITGRRTDGSIEAVLAPDVDATTPPKRVWHMRFHNAETGGTNVLSALIPTRRFEYPKSLYAVEDTLRFVVGNKRDALVLDFFAGSGTTSHAVARLNKQDDGRRRSICVTNNEVSADEAERLEAQGLRPGDPAWEAYGVCEHITKPRIRAAISGKTPEGEPIKGGYKFIDEFPMAEGFEENVEFFDLTYEDPELVRYGLDFEAIAPLLWFRAGSEGTRVNSVGETFAVADTYAVLFDVDAAAAFVAAVRSKPALRIAYVVTDDETQFQVVAGQLPHSVEPVRLYAAYLDNFRIQAGG